MSLNHTPSADRLHIGIFGKRNAGKSSLINAITGQELAIVSDTPGTTTDPVLKAMELLPLGPVVIIDTPGLDDEGALGVLRVNKAFQALNKTDIAILVVDAAIGITDTDKTILERIKAKKIPHIVVMNKSDLAESTIAAPEANTISVSAKNKNNIETLKELIARQMPPEQNDRFLVKDLIRPSDFVILVVPIDQSAPKGRLILPQQQTIRDILESDAVSIVIKENQLKKTLASSGKTPALVITDSQVFAQVSADTPEAIPLTSFSILFARYRGDLTTLANGAHYIDQLKDGDKILIAEGCTHHRQCEDIGTVKLPRLLEKYSKKQFHYEFTSGNEFPDDLTAYQLIIHCGACMINTREMSYRLNCAKDQHIPITNYGIAIAHMTGILERSLKPFDIQKVNKTEKL